MGGSRFAGWQSVRTFNAVKNGARSVGMERKVCVICGGDCSGEARYQDESGCYYDQKCFVQQYGKRLPDVKGTIARHQRRETSYNKISNLIHRLFMLLSLVGLLEALGVFILYGLAMVIVIAMAPWWVALVQSLVFVGFITLFLWDELG